MNTLNMPSFTAEISLYKQIVSYGNYRAQVTNQAGEGVVMPQFSVASIYRALVCGACAAAIASPVPGDELALCTLCARLAVSD
jgi:hypothetical protein